jgi:hypothetical protein
LVELTTLAATESQELLEAQMSAVRTCLAGSAAKDRRLTLVLAAVHEVLRRRAVAPLPATVQARRFDAARWPDGKAERLRLYDELVDRLRSRVSDVVPAGASIAVVSRGDQRLVELKGIRAWHFPRGRDGRYAGHYPPDGGKALSHLRDLVADGIEYLVVPATAFWWFDHYPELDLHLRPLAIHTDEDYAVFDVRPRTTSRGAAT